MTTNRYGQPYFEQTTRNKSSLSLKTKSFVYFGKTPPPRFTDLNIFAHLLGDFLAPDYIKFDHKLDVHT